MSDDSGGAPGRARSVYVTVHRRLVREGLRYTDRATGEEREFNVVQVPAGTVVGGRDVGGYEFSPLYVDPARFADPEEYRDVPLLADREVWLRRCVLGPDGRPETDGDGRRVRDTVKVMPAELKEAVREGMRRWEAERGRDGRTLAERSRGAREASGAIAAPGPARPDARAGQ